MNDLLVKPRIEEVKYAENFNFIVFGTQNILLYDLRYPHFPVSELPLSINFKGLEIKEVKNYGNDFDTKSYYAGLDISHKDQCHLLFDIEISREIIIHEEKNIQENLLVKDYYPNQEQNDLSCGNENENINNKHVSHIYNSSNNNDSFEENKNNNDFNNNYLNRRARYGSDAIEIDDEYSLSSTAKNYKEQPIAASDSRNITNLKTKKKKEMNEFNKDISSSYINSPSLMEKENDFSELSVNNVKLNNLVNDNSNNYKAKIKCEEKAHLDEDYKQIYAECKEKKMSEKKLLSDFFTDFCNVNLISTYGKVHDVTGFLFEIPQWSLDIDKGYNLSSSELLNPHNEIYERLLLGTKSELKNKNKFYVNFSIDSFAGINCYIHKLINTNNFASLNKRCDYDLFGPNKNMFIDNHNNYNINNKNNSKNSLSETNTIQTSNKYISNYYTILIKNTFF